MAYTFDITEEVGAIMQNLKDHPEDRDEFIVAVVRYGSFKEEPEFTNDEIAELFESVRAGIDSSRIEE